MLLCISPFACSSEWYTFKYKDFKVLNKSCPVCSTHGEGCNKHVNSNWTDLGLPWLVFIFPHGCEFHPKVHLLFSFPGKSLVLAEWPLDQWDDIFGEESVFVHITKKPSAVMLPQHHNHNPCNVTHYSISCHWFSLDISQTLSPRPQIGSGLKLIFSH